MKSDIHAGKRVLYKHNKQWCVGILIEGHNTRLTDKGLFLTIMPIEFKDSPNDAPYVHDAEINDIFLDGIELSEYDKSDPDFFMTKKEYEDFVESEDFVAAAETAWVSDGEYYYYPINKYNRTWLEKQPFDYVLRGY